MKWGDKREAEVEPLMKKLIKEKFGLTDFDFREKHLPGTETVKLDKPPMLKPAQLDFLKSIVGSENLRTMISPVQNFHTVSSTMSCLI